MNQYLAQLQPYPFEKLGDLLKDVVPNVALDPISLSIGEPKHQAADFLLEFMADPNLLASGVSGYPPTKGSIDLRTAIAGFINRRFKLVNSPIDPKTQVLPVNGTREALFAFAQTIIDSTVQGQGANNLTLMPNPFYQIYEGAAILAGSQPYFLNCTYDTGFVPDFDAVTADVWQRCQLIYICNPGNPSGAVMGLDKMQDLIRLADQYDFVIASDECYSEIYASEKNPPPGLLEAAHKMGRFDYQRCVSFNSLSKRSNLPGLRSGYVAGDADLVAKFLTYRTYHGSAMPAHSQKISALAWSDEVHVAENRALYRQKFAMAKDLLGDVWPIQQPDASFYLWPETPVCDQLFTQKLIQHCNIKVLPGSFLSRDTEAGNPGAGRIRMALVASMDECEVALRRLRTFMEKELYLV